MLTGVDRVQVVVRDRAAVATAFARLLGGERMGDDTLRVLGARRTVVRLGTSAIELLEPDGSGAAAEFLSRCGGGLFAAGFATADMEQLRTHLESRGIPVVEEGGQLHLADQALGADGLHAVISPEETPAPAGLTRGLYEVTLLVSKVPPVAQSIAATFRLDATHFVPIRSEQYGYDGVLTLFHPDHLDRIEVITPYDPAKTMGRFFGRRGASLYMCYAEADDLTPIRARLLEQTPNDWTGPREGPLDNLFIHPNALGGMMLGLSRTTFAWTWSGHPERVVSGGSG